MSKSSLRNLPSVDKVLHSLGPSDLPRAIVVGLVRRALERWRSEGEIPSFDSMIEQLSEQRTSLGRSRIQPVINGTGVLIHTNLGRAPLGSPAVEMLTEIASQYNNLEYDLADGERGRRSPYLDECLALLCESEAATVVNNNAAALILILRHLCTGDRNRVVISRGELVQIGGGFRVPEILEAAGARLCEVGTTNRTAIEDYRSALGDETALILKVHRSNFFMSGFVASPRTEELAALASESGVPLVEDLGSGAVIPTETTGLQHHEPTPAERLKQGVDLVCFSGDKLFGGPQAGILAGKAELIQGVKREPLFRALRCDKLILGALQAVADAYLAHQEAAEVPVWAMLQIPLDRLAERAHVLMEELPGLVEVATCSSRVGGGALPRAAVDSIALELNPGSRSLDELSAALRQCTPPVIGYISRDRFLIDLRTVFPEQDAILVEHLRRVLAP